MGTSSVSAKNPETSSLISPSAAVSLFLVAVFSAAGFLALLAYAPDFRQAGDTGAHALSKSAVGFAGLRALIEDDGTSTVIGRQLPLPADVRPSLVVLTPPAEGLKSDALSKAIRKANGVPVLLILPKWDVAADPLEFGRVLKLAAIPLDGVAGELRSYAKHSSLARGKGVAAPKLIASRQSAIPLSAPLAPVDSLQTLSGVDWTPLISENSGGAILACAHGGAAVCAIADPDFMNTHALKDLATAALALAIVGRTRSGNGPVVFDVTLNGLAESPGLLKTAFSPPFLGATICLFAAGLLIGWHAMVRFGSPLRSDPVYARGKLALANNAAGLIRMLGREPEMASRYALTTRNLVMRRLGLRRGPDERLFETLMNARERNTAQRYQTLLFQARYVKNRSALIGLAGRLYEWKQEMLDARH